MASRSRMAKVIGRQKIHNRRTRLVQRRSLGGALWRAFKLGVGLVLVGGLAVLGYAFYRFAFTSGYFELKKLVITGVSEEIAGQIRTLIQLEPNQGANLLLLRAERIRESILQHPRIESVQVAKHYPNALLISAAERRPAAIVASDGLYMIDRQGYVLERLHHLDTEKSRFPFVSGLDPQDVNLGQKIRSQPLAEALNLYDCLQATNPRIAGTLSEIRIGRGGYLTAVLNRGVEVRFGRENFTDALARLDLLMNRQPNLGRLDYIDLRFDQEIVYKDRLTSETHGT